MSTARLVSVGNVIIDVTLGIPTLPDRGGDVVASDRGRYAGGAFNTLAAASRQGLASAYGNRHGSGPFGDLARAALTAEGIELLLEPTPDTDTGFDLALVDDEGERTFITVFGAEAELAVTDLARIHLGVSDAVHVSGYGLLPRTNAGVLAPWIAGIAPAHTVLVDPGPLCAQIAPTVLTAVAGRADWLSCNLSEALRLSGASDAAHAATLLRTNWRAVVIRLGAQGCLVATDDIELIPGFSVEAVDTNGAGDAHVGAFLAGLAAGMSAGSAARRANACAALAVTRFGPSTAPSAREVRLLLEATSA